MDERTMTADINLYDRNVRMTIFKSPSDNSNDISNDIVSKDLSALSCWEPFQTEVTKEILTKDDGLFIDIGCHLGYYSIIACLLGKNVISVDNCDTYLNMFRKTIEDNQLERIKIIKVWIDEKFDINNLEINDSQVSLIKIDIEGNEPIIVDKLMDLIGKGKISNMIIEISPKFNDQYPNMCLKLKSLGYNIYDIGLSPPRALKFNTNHMDNLDSQDLTTLSVSRLTDYINSLEYGQSNFLFTFL